jgi:hypothetical protein
MSGLSMCLIPGKKIWGRRECRPATLWLDGLIMTPDFYCFSWAVILSLSQDVRRGPMRYGSTGCQ